MKKAILVFSLFILLTSAVAQNYEKIVIDKNDPVTGYYLAVPPQGEIEGVLVLFPGFGERPENVLPECPI